MSERERAMTDQQIIEPVKEGHSALIYFSLVLVCLLCVLVFSFFQEQSKRLLSASVNSKAKSLLGRIDSESVNKASWYLNILFFINVLLFTYGLSYKYELLSTLGVSKVVLVSGGILLLFLSKYFVHYFLGFLFKTDDIAKQYLEELYLKYKLFGVLLFPLVLLLLFSPKYAGLAVFLGVSTYIVLWISVAFFALKTGLMSKSLPRYYPFLYICTLEILPLVIAGKIFQAPIVSFIGL